MDWLKLYHDARTDPKLASLTWPQLGVWLNLLIYASEQPNRGIIEGKTNEVLALQVARGDVDLLNETLSRLVTLQIVTCVTGVTSCDTALHRVTGVKINFLNFDKRQLDPSTIRQRKHRERKKLQQHVTNVTPLSRDVTPVTPELELELELENKKFSHIAGAHAREEQLSEVNPPQPPSTPQRNPDDQAEFDEACRILAMDLRTESLAIELSRRATLPEILEIPGWKFRRGSAVLLAPERTDGQRRSLAYFLEIVRNIPDTERFAQPRASLNGRGASFESASERRERSRKESENRLKNDPELRQRLDQDAEDAEMRVYADLRAKGKILHPEILGHLKQWEEKQRARP